MPSQVILVTGGTRSGKSRFAVQLARRFGRRIVYIATCRPADREMRRRVTAHRRERPSHWRTIEPSADLAAGLARVNGGAQGVILDCLTMYISGLLSAGRSEAAIRAQVSRLVRAARRAACPVIIVTNEVGWGVVPERPLGRAFRDVAGRMNQLVAAQADTVYLIVAGLPMTLKGAPRDHR